MEHLYSGLETEGMKVLKCTLKLQPHWEYQHDILTLPPKRVTVPMDGSDAKNVMFHGWKVMQLALSGGRREGELVMPVSFTIGGPCTYNKEDKKDFEIMMRSKEQSLCMKIPPNGNFDWPDYRAFETCPGCCTPKQVVVAVVTGCYSNLCFNMSMPVKMRVRRRWRSGCYVD